MTVDSSATGCSRRSLLRAGAVGALGVSASLSGCIGIILGGGYYQQQARRRQSMAGGAPISFASQRQRIRKQDAEQTVSTPTQLIQAAKQPKTTIWIPGDVTIDMTGQSNIPIAPNVRIASNRHLGGGTGALLRCDDYAHLFTVPQRGARLTGVRLQGPQPKYRDFSTEQATYAHAAYGITFNGTSGIVDNCELWGWPGYAIGAGTSDTATQLWMHHNDIHHTQLGGLGYGLESLNGMSLVEWNYFSHYRHVVSGYGYNTNGYEFRCNVVGPPSPDPSSFACDMHRLGEQSNFPPSNQQAGKYINVHHNVFALKQENAMSISGIPTMYARFVNNWTAHSKGGDGPGEPAVYIPDGGKLKMRNNNFGQEAVKRGRKRLQQLNVRVPISNGKPSASAWSPPRRGTATKNATTTNNGTATTTPSGSVPQQRRQTPPPGERPITEVV